MPRAFAAYNLADRLGGDPQVDGSSSGTAVIVSLTPPKGATAMMLQAKTTAARLSFTGEDPDATAKFLLLPAGLAPVFFPFVPREGQALKFASDAAAVSDLTVLWLE